MNSPHSSQVRAAGPSSNWATGVCAPKRYNIHGSAKNNTKPFSPGIASNGNQRRRAAR